MLFYFPLGNFVDGQRQANQDNFQDAQNRLALDTQAQQTNEFFAGAEGRQAAIQLESDTVASAARTLGQQENFQQLTGARVNNVLGNAGLTNVRGTYNQALSQQLIPKIPQLSTSAANTIQGNALNKERNATVIYPQQQQIQQGRQQTTLDQMPLEIQQKLLQKQAGIGQLNNQIALQPGAQQIGLQQQLNQQALLPLQGAAQMAQTAAIPDQVAYNQEVLKGKAAVLPFQQSAQIQQAQATAAGLPAQLQSQAQRQTVNDALGATSRLILSTPNSQQEALAQAQPITDSLKGSGLLSPNQFIAHNGSGWIIRSTPNVQGATPPDQPLNQFVGALNQLANPPPPVRRSESTRVTKKEGGEAAAPANPALGTPPVQQVQETVATQEQVLQQDGLEKGMYTRRNSIIFNAMSALLPAVWKDKYKFPSKEAFLDYVFTD